MELIQQVCTMPLAREVRAQSLTIHSHTAVTLPSPSASPSQTAVKESRVLLGLPETELQGRSRLWPDMLKHQKFDFEFEFVHFADH